ncbi:TetR/AcrR family transcriptional regulator [Litorihabitans aurantiacus]|uniref:TetR family transcriptional regulator n=1 Tax=Litorihabitans aurantiacus TaxID=1930061 RepID=A0AA37XCS3_9MICO|nr:TetR/AcrR family transcriptional regulator [Litorihabitans aurantiacus]GMA30180.1 TetR family transcriptional regulator [Litorihabitans aurantiacus]
MSRVVEDVATRTDVAEGDARPDGRSRRWDTHRAARLDELTRAARRAIHHGGPDLSMDEIATAIGTSKSIVYRYFSDRSGLQTAVGEAVLRDMGSALADATHRAHGPHAVIRAMVGVYLEMISTSPSVYAFVTRGGDSAPSSGPLRTLADDAAALLVPVLADVVADQGGDPARARMWSAGVIGFVRGSAEVWLADREGAGSAAGAHDVDAAELHELADTLADWICVGTPAVTSPHPTR